MNEIKLEKRTEGERQAYLDGFEAGKRVWICIGQRTEWIPASERLPKEGQEVLVNDRSGSMWVWTLYKGTRVPWQWEDSYGYFQDFEDIIAWQPLPEPYEGE